MGPPNEPKYCNECGRPLRVYPTDQRDMFWWQCPKANLSLFNLLTRVDTKNHYYRTFWDYPKSKYDPQTGAKL